MARAFGKVILTGEHAVVYGVPALAAGLDVGATAQTAIASHAELRLGGNLCPEGSETFFAYQRLLNALVFEGQSAPPMRAEAELQLPPGVGLGASAAIAVALARAIAETLRPERAIDDAQIFYAAQEWESVFHGNASGIDAACALVGGCIRFVKGHAWQPVVVKQPLELAVAIAGPASPTKEMVERVARQREANPDVFDDVLTAIAEVVSRAESCLAELSSSKGALTDLGELFDENQRLLARWGVSTPEIEQACHLARQAGALGAKLTGAGGGGAVIALAAPGEAERVIAAWRRAGVECFATRVG